MTGRALTVDIAARRLLSALAAWAVIATFLVLAPVGAQTNGDNTPQVRPNADLPPACGVDFSLIVDRSGSISDNNDEVEAAGQALVDALRGTGSSVQLISFSETATAHDSGEVTGSTSIADATYHPVEDFDVPVFTSNGVTNWEDALEMVRRSPSGPSPLTIVITDGRPTARNTTTGSNVPGPYGTPGNGHLGGTTTDGSGSTSSEAEIDEAIREANAIKATGSHVLVVAVGTGLSSDDDQTRIQLISGTDELVVDSQGVPVPGSKPFGESDFTLIENFNILTSAFRNFVKELCSPTLNVTKKIVPPNGDIAAAANGPGWDFTATLDPTPSIWESPAGATGSTASATTDGDGVAKFKWEPPLAQPFATTDISLTESAQPGFEFLGAVCESENFDGDPREQIFDSLGDADPALTIAIALAYDEGGFCTFYNRQFHPGEIRVDKTATPTSLVEDGGSVTFDVRIDNISLDDSDVTITSLVDDIHGNLNGQGTCSLPRTIPQGGNYQCSFTADVNGNAGDSETDTVTATGTDEFGNPVADDDSATVVITNANPSIEVTKTADPVSVPEPGGNVTFSVDIDNNSGPTDPVTITSLVDDIHGDLDGQGTCDVPRTIQPGDTYSCEFTVFVGGNAGESETDTVTASGTDDEQTPVSDSDDATVTIADTPSGIDVTKTATPTSLPEPGGTVTFGVDIDNISQVDSVTIDSLVDDIHGNLDGQGNCSVPQTIAAGDTYSCSFTANVSGNAGDTETDTVTASGTDDDGNPVTDSDTATVTITDVASGISVLKTASPTSVLEPGANVTFDVRVTNDSPVDTVTINTLVDDIHGDLNGQGTCAVPQTLVAGDTYDCSFVALVGGNAGDSETDTVTALGIDDDGNPVSDSDDARVDILDAAPAIEVIKTADPTSVVEPGGIVTFSIDVRNTSVSSDPVTITSLTDDIHGDLDGQGTCDVPTTIQPGDTYSCEFSANVSGNVGDTETDTVTASGTDDDGTPVSDSDDATVNVEDALPSIVVTKVANPTNLPEPGGDVTFSVDVRNTSVSSDPVTITSLTDDIHGNLNGQGDCAVPQTIQPGATYSCDFGASVLGNAGDSETDTVTASGTDDDGNPVTDSDQATVIITDTPSSIDVTKTANPTSVPEPGADVTFSIAVANTSAVDSVTITTLVDDIHGDLNGQGDCAVPRTISAGSTYTCEFTAFVGGNAGDTETDTVTASGTDDDGNPVTDSDQATVTISDVPSSILVDKTADPVNVDEPGANVTFSVVVTNTSTVDTVTISSLTDDVHGDLNGQGDCTVPQTLAAGASYDCSFVAFVGGNAGESETDTVTASGTDDDGNPVTDDDDAVVTIGDVGSSIDVDKDAVPSSVPELGANVTFSVQITNTSAVDTVVISSLVDDIHGDLNGQGDCSVPQTLAAGASYDCSFVAFVGGNAGESETDTVTASGTDDDGAPVSDSDQATVTITDVPSSIDVTKAADPVTVTEPGGTVTFTVDVANTSTVDSVTITSLTDDIHGDLDGQGDCSVPRTLAVGASFSCAFTADVNGNAGDTETDTVTAGGTDDDGNPVTDSDQATVTVIDELPAITVIKDATPSSIAEPGATVTFDVEVVNDSVGSDPVTITSLVDDIHGDLTGQGTCAVPQTIQPGAGYSCSFDALVSGNAGDTETDTVTASGTDDEGNPVTDSDQATVSIFDVVSSIEVTKAANPTTVPEPGGNVTFSVEVANTSSVDTVTINDLTDDIHGDLNGRGDCSVPQTLVPGAGYSCSFDADVNGNAGDTETDTVTAGGVDDDGTPLTDSDQATVTVVDVLPAIEVVKTVDPTSIPETGAEVTYTFSVENLSPEPVTLTGLADDKLGDLNGQGDCALPQDLAVGGTYSCQASTTLASSGPGTHENVVTGIAFDDEGNPATDDDNAVVTFEDVIPSITVVKTADPTSIPETGAVVTYTYEVTNDSDEDLTLVELIDDKLGDLDGQGDCVLDVALAPNGEPDDSYTCSVETTLVASGPGEIVNIVTAVAVDNEGNQATDDDDAVVTFGDVLPEIDLVKTADPTSVSENGDTVTFTFEITSSSDELLTLTTLTDDVFGDLDGQGDCSLPQFLAPTGQDGDSYTCAFSAFLAGNSTEIHENVATAVAVDDEGNPATDDDDAVVTFDDTPPEIDVTKTGTPEVVVPEGGDVVFTVDVDNLTAEPVTITSITDKIGDGPVIDVTVVGDTVVATTCETGIEIDPLGSYSCAFTVFTEGDPGEVIEDTVVVAVVDDENNPATDNDDEDTVISNDVADLAIEKSASTLTIGEPGSYTLRVTNNGPATAFGVVVTDTLPNGITLGTVDADGWDCSNSTTTDVLCTRPEMAADTSSTITLNVNVSPDLAIGDVVNVTEVKSETFDPDPTNNRDELITPLTQVQAEVVQPLAITGASVSVKILVAGLLVALGSLFMGWGRRRELSDADADAVA